MRTLERISAWLGQHRGKSYCDVCIAGRLDFARGRRAVWRSTKLLGANEAFRREKGPCSGCASERMVIRAV